MPVFLVTLEKTADFSVVAENLEQAKKAVDELDDRDIDNDYAWDVSWDKNVCEDRSKKSDPEKADCGVFDGEILALSDYKAAVAKYEKEHAEEIERKRQAEQAKHTLPLFPEDAK
jgi:hypothetical protein